MAVITIVTSAPPLTEGGHLVLARSLERALLEAGHRAGIVTTPSNRFGRQGPAYLANWLTDVGMTGSGERVDQVISLRFPSYAVRHPAHVCWLVHTMREYYDLWDRFQAQDRTYRDDVLPPTIRARVTVEAAATFGWERWAGTDGATIGLDRFGASAPGDTNLKNLGFTVERVVEVARSLG